MSFAVCSFLVNLFLIRGEGGGGKLEYPQKNLQSPNIYLRNCDVLSAK